MDLQSRIHNIIENKKSVSLRFLNLQEQSLLSNKKEVYLYGGYEQAERKRAYFLDNQEDNIIPVKLSYNQKYLSLTHQNILGTLLSLGITFDSIGDILPKQGIFFITKEISKEVLASFTTINNVEVICFIYKGYIESETTLEEHRTTLDSMRLDLVVSKITKSSRKDAQELIQKELIKVNHQVVTKPTLLLKESDILSIRKHGRFRIEDTKKRSKKGKIVLIYLKYV